MTWVIAHVVVVDDDGMVVDRRAVAAQDDHVVEVGILPGDPALTLSSITVSPSVGALSRTTGLTPAGASFGSRSRQRPS